jgi:hypothetical protein
MTLWQVAANCHRSLQLRQSFVLIMQLAGVVISGQEAFMKVAHRPGADGRGLPAVLPAASC